MSALLEIEAECPREIVRALAGKRWESARRLCLRTLETTPEDDGRFPLLLCALREACVSQGDFTGADAALARIKPGSDRERFEILLAHADDLMRRADADLYRISDEVREGLSLEQYFEKWQGKAAGTLDKAAPLAALPEDRRRIEARRRRRHAHQADDGALLAPPSELALRLAGGPSHPQETSRKRPGRKPETGRIAGILRLGGRPAAGIELSLGLEAEVETLDPRTTLHNEMNWRPRIAPLKVVRTATDAEGRFSFEAVPEGRHEFIAARLDPEAHDLPTRFVAHQIAVAAGEETRLDLSADEWITAPALEKADPFPVRLERAGRAYRKVHGETIRNPFHYGFPRQEISFPLPPGVDAGAACLLLSSHEGGVPQPFQISGGEVLFFAELPPQSERAFAFYVPEGDALPAPSFSLPDLELRPEAGGRTAFLDTGRACFRLAFGGEGDVPPLVAVRGEDGVWRGQGRLVLPPGMGVVSRRTALLEAGPLRLRARIEYALSDGTSDAVYAWEVTAHRDEACLLVREISPEIEGAAFEFSLREWSGGRGYLYWKPEKGDRHWTDLKAEDRELARIQESVAWWIPPQGFGYAMTPPAGEGGDYLALFSRRRGEWIDRKFARLAQGPGDDRRELDWPFPEMVGSTISMITARTDASGDAFFRCAFFDGERQWGLLVSTLERNDGPWKELSEVAHKNSSPRLQDFKGWNLDVPDAAPRPSAIARRGELRGLRRKGATPVFAPYRERILAGREHNGPVAGIRFVLDGDPATVWTRKLELIHMARYRSRMVLLGRDFSDVYSPVGARAVTPMMEDYDLLAPAGCFSPEEEREMRAFFILMGHMHMQPDLMNWKFNSRNANFEADRVDVVGTIGVCFPGHPDAGAFIEHALSLMESSLRVYCTPGSGKWYENPACYYLHAAKCRLNLVFHLFRKGLFDPARFPRLKDFLRWGVLLLMPPTPHQYERMRDGVPPEADGRDGLVRRLPPIGDHAHIGSWVPEFYALMSRVYRESDPAFADLLLAAYQSGGRDGGYYSNAAMVLAALSEDDLKPVPLPELPSRRLEGFGAVFRGHFGTPDEFYLLLKQGPGGYRYHRTEGGLLLFAGGKPLLYDGGEAGETWRHSTLSFHDVGMPLAAGHVERFHDLPGLGFVQGVHPEAIAPGEPVFLSDKCDHHLVETALARFAEPHPVDVRTLFVVRDEYIVLDDDLRIGPEIPCRWHLQVVAEDEKGDARRGYRFRGRFGVDLQVLLPGQAFVEDRVERLPIHDLVRPPEESFAMRHLALRAEAPSHYFALLRPMAGGRSEVRARLVPSPKGSRAARVEGEGIEDDLFLSRNRFAFAGKGVSFEGRYGAVERRPGALFLHLFAGSRIEAEGASIESDGPAVALRLPADGSPAEVTAEGAGTIRIGLPGGGLPFRRDLAGGLHTFRLGR